MINVSLYWKRRFSEWLIFQHCIAITPDYPGAFNAGFSFLPKVQNVPISEAKTAASLVVFIIVVVLVFIIFIGIVMRLMHLVVPELPIGPILFDQILV